MPDKIIPMPCDYNRGPHVIAKGSVKQNALER